MHGSQSGIKSNINQYFTAAMVFMVAFFVSFMASSLFAPASPSNATTSDVSATLNATGYYVNVTANNIDLNINTTPQGATDIEKSTIITKTNAPSGYKLYLSMLAYDDYDPTHPGNALYQDGDSTSSNFISPTTGTISAPAALARDSWGMSESGSTDSFYAVPLLSDPILLQTTSSANESGVQKDVYFGAKASYALPSGEYNNTIAYTTLAEGTGTGSGEMSISPEYTTANASGEELTLVTSLYTSYDFATSDITVTIGGTTCPVTEASISDSYHTLLVKCTALWRFNYNDHIVYSC